MGIRIHKFLGYGLDSVTENDPRINFDSWILHCENYPGLSEYQEWLSAREESLRGYHSLDLWHLRDAGKHPPPADSRWRKDQDLLNCVAWNCEATAPRPLVLRLLSMPDWSRNDDTIDYTQETFLARSYGLEAVTDRLEMVNACIYPWDGQYMDDRTGDRLDQKIMMWVRSRNRSLEEPVSPGTLDLFAQEAGFTDHAEAQAHVFPVVPQEIRDLAEFSGVFTDETVWRQMKPLLYTYWR